MKKEYVKPEIKFISIDEYQEALDALSDTSCMSIRDCSCEQCTANGPCGHYQCVKKLQELVDKETPKKPKSKLYGITGEGQTFHYHYCPICGFYSVEKDYANYCPRCGQKLDWSDKVNE